MSRGSYERSSEILQNEEDHCFFHLGDTFSLPRAGKGALGGYFSSALGAVGIFF